MFWKVWKVRVVQGGIRRRWLVSSVLRVLQTIRLLPGMLVVLNQ